MNALWLSKRRVGVSILQRAVCGGFLHDVLVGVVEEVRGAAGVLRGENDVQADVEGLPGVAQGDGVVVEGVQLLHALEAVVDI